MQIERLTDICAIVNDIAATFFKRIQNAQSARHARGIRGVQGGAREQQETRGRGQDG